MANQPVENHAILGLRRSFKGLIKGIITYLDFILPSFGLAPKDTKKKEQNHHK